VGWLVGVGWVVPVGVGGSSGRPRSFIRPSPFTPKQHHQPPISPLSCTCTHTHTHTHTHTSKHTHTSNQPQRRAHAAGRLLRVVLIYGRSNCIPVTPSAPNAAAAAASALPGPAAAAAVRGRGGGLPIDCVYIHDKPVQGVNCPQVRGLGWLLAWGGKWLLACSSSHISTRVVCYAKPLNQRPQHPPSTPNPTPTPTPPHPYPSPRTSTAL